MRLASSDEESVWVKTSETKLIRLGTCIVTMDQSLALLSAYFGMTAEIGSGHGFVAPQFLGLAAQHDTSGLQDVAVISDGKSHARVLLEKQDRGVAPDLRDDPEHRLHDHRC